HGEQGYVFFGEGEACRASLDRNGQPVSEIQVSRSVIARVVRDRKPVAILDIGQDEELQQKASLMIRNVRSVMCVPLLLDDHLVGLIYISSPTANKTFTRHDLDLMSAISAQVALALENAQAYETIKELNAGLEQKVKERTEDLERALHELTDTQAQLVETEKLATVGTLAGGVAHEINNPLGAILTNAQLLKLDIDDPEQRDSLDLIEEGARRCKEIVAALLRYSRGVESNAQPVNLRAALDDVLAALEPRVHESGATLELALERVPLVLGDLPEFRQLLTHLLNNALDALADCADGERRLALALKTEPGSVSFAVTDNGPGMAPEIVKRIFDPFFTTKKVGSGTGLGLSVCQRIVEKYSGRLLVRTAPGEGATFTLLLPSPEQPT
ncbi:MAG TPA: ATP-binding protein, partial [Oscillatoriaceae cyanobacterium]